MQAGAGRQAGARQHPALPGPWAGVSRGERGWQRCSGSGDPAATSRSSRTQPSPFPGTVASGAIFRPTFCFLLFFLIPPPRSSPKLSTALETLGKRKAQIPGAGSCVGGL